MNPGTVSKKEKKEVTLPGFLPLQKKIHDVTKDPVKKILLLAGPTACGKTSLSLMLAVALGGEIVSADSMQVYRGMDIGTAKVSYEDQQRIPHHLIDIRDVHEAFNVVDFYYEAKQCIDSILSRNRVPIVVGGSGFYFRTLLFGPPAGPPSIPEVRHEIEQEMERLGADRLFTRLKETDPIYAATITPNDRQKIVRALEIVTLTGGKVSDLEWKRDKALPDYRFHPWFLYRPREILYKRIEERCDEMLDMGLIDEVKVLIKKGLLQNSSAKQAIGYRQVLDYLQTPQTKKDYEELVRHFKTASRHYAKRQFTWFGKESLFVPLNVEVHDFEIAMEMILRDFYASI